MIASVPTLNRPSWLALIGVAFAAVFLYSTATGDPTILRTTGSVPAVADRCLLSVHAHPDDEASKGASTVARYKSEGVRAVLVTCTGGEEGEILNPAMDRPEVRADLAAVRRQ